MRVGRMISGLGGRKHAAPTLREGVLLRNAQLTILRGYLS